MLKRHLRQQRAVEEYGRNIKQLAGRAQSLLSAGHPEGWVHQPGGLARSRGSGQRPHQPGSLRSRWENRNSFPKTMGLRKLLLDCRLAQFQSTPRFPVSNFKRPNKVWSAKGAENGVAKLPSG